MLANLHERGGEGVVGVAREAQVGRVDVRGVRHILGTVERVAYIVVMVYIVMA